ncbi:MAG: DUF4157 domain-containing protein [Acidobacteriota bacterium]
MIQPKLTINKPGDIYEQEADRIAEQVMHMPEPASVPQSPINSRSVKPSFQSISPHAEKDIQRKEDDDEEEEGIVQMKQGSMTHPAGRQPGVPPIVREVLRSSGQPLDPTTIAFMEPRFGYDFSSVRVHDNTTAHRAASGQLARAFTVGNHIVFNLGRYESSSTEGKHLLAHELTHVVQQAGTVMRRDTSLAHKNYACNAVAEVSQALSVGLQRQPLSEEEIANLQFGDIEKHPAPAIVKIKVEQRQTGAAWGYYANGDSTLIEILTNTLEPGIYKIVPAGASKGPTDSEYVQRVGPGFAFREPAINFHPEDPVTVTIQRAPMDRFARLPDYIKSYLLMGAMTGSRKDMEQLVDEGERLLGEGITAADLAMAAQPSAAIEVEGTAPREDLVDSLRRRGFSDFPSREEYYRRLARDLVNSSDYRRWWTKEAIAAYWKEFPEQAAEDWNKFADKLYTRDKQAEEAAWLEAFRRIDAAAGAVDAIAVVTLVVAGGFAGAEIVSLPALPALPATIQGVPTAVWAKTLFAAGLSASYLSHVYSRSVEASEHGGANPFVIAVTAVDDALAMGKVYESAKNQSLLTGEPLKMSTTERIVGGLTGGLELVMNLLGVKDILAEPLPTIMPPSKATPPAAPEPQPQVPAPSGPAPWTAEELAAMKKQDITSLADYKAAKEAETLKLAQEQQQTLEIVQQQAEPQAAQMSGGRPPGPGSRNAPPRTRTSTTGLRASSSSAGRTAKRATVFKRVGPPAQPPHPAAPVLTTTSTPEVTPPTTTVPKVTQPETVKLGPTAEPPKPAPAVDEPKPTPFPRGTDVTKRGPFPPLKPEDSVWVQLRDGRIREYKPSEVEGELVRGGEITTVEGRGMVVSRGEPPHSWEVSHPAHGAEPSAVRPSAKPLGPDETARRLANELRQEIVKDLSKPGRSGGAIGAQADKRVGAELIRIANKTADKELEKALKALGERLIERGKSGLHK